MILAATCLASTGCVRRTITVTSEPDGALVWVNDREVGRTPLEFEFVYYGTYDVRLARDGYEPMITVGEAKAPWWDTVGLDFAAELVPGDLHADLHWHYDLEPTEPDTDLLREQTVERARDARARLRASLPDQRPATTETVSQGSEPELEPETVELPPTDPLGDPEDE